jgi:uncharacterized protein (DUF1697 family)
MNVGNRRMRNEELVSVFVDAGHADVSAYQASGNVILGRADFADEEQISATLKDALDYDVDVFVRTSEELHAIASKSPLIGRTGVAGGRPQIVFIKAADDFDHAASFPDDHEVHVVGTELHWLPPAGLSQMGEFRFPAGRPSSPTTVRTLGTVQRLSNRLR